MDVSYIEQRNKCVKGCTSPFHKIGCIKRRTMVSMDMEHSIAFSPLATPSVISESDKIYALHRSKWIKCSQKK